MRDRGVRRVGRMWVRWILNLDELTFFFLTIVLFILWEKDGALTFSLPPHHSKQTAVPLDALTTNRSHKQLGSRVRDGQIVFVFGHARKTWLQKCNIYFYFGMGVKKIINNFDSIFCIVMEYQMISNGWRMVINIDTDKSNWCCIIDKYVQGVWLSI